MNAQNQESELWKRKFGPVTDWRPASGASRSAGGAKSVFDDGLAQAQSAAVSLVKMLEPIAVEARDKIKDITSVLDQTVSKSSTEARSFVAKTLEAMAAKIKPE